MKDYVKLYVCSDGVKASLVKGILEEHDIPVSMINKQDSSYVFLGDYELWVPEVFAEEALAVFNEIALN
jgi:hypothetical protein